MKRFASRATARLVCTVRRQTDVVGPLALRVLHVIVTGKKPLKVRAIAREVGCAPKSVGDAIRELRKQGLITWQWGEGGTLTSLVRFKRRTLR